MPAGDPTRNAARVLDAGVPGEAALSTAVLESRAVGREREVLPGGTPDPEGSLTRDFFRRLAEELLVRLPGVPGHGEERLALVERVTAFVERMLTGMAGRDSRWQEWVLDFVELERGSGTAATTDRVIARILEYVNPEEILAVEQMAAQVSAYEALERHTPDEAFDPAEVLAALGSVDRLRAMASAPGPAAIDPTRYALAIALAATPRLPGGVPSSKEDGIEVHKRVQAHYARHRPGAYRVMERVVFSPSGQRLADSLAQAAKKYVAGRPELGLLDFSVGTGLRTRLRPDIVDFRAPVGEVYEIKPRSQAVQALIQVDGYCAAYNLIPFPGKLPLEPGTTYTPPRLVRATGRKVAVVYRVPGLPGLVLYDLFEGSRDAFRALEYAESTAPVTAMTAVLAMIVALGIAAVVTTLDPIPGDEVPFYAGAGALLRVLQAM